MSENILYHIDNDLGAFFGVHTALACLFSALVPYFVWRTIRWQKEENRQHLDGAHVIGCATVLIAAIILWWSSAKIIVRHFELSDRLQSGNVEVIRGRVSIESHFPAHGHGHEQVRIGEHLFDYSPNDLTQGGLKSPGILKQGMHVKVTHVDGVIVQVERLSQNTK